MILHFQPASTEEDLPRYKKIIKKHEGGTKLESFTKKERRAIVAKLEDLMHGEEDLEASDGDDDDEDSEDEDPDEDDLAFIADDDEDEEEEEDEDEEEEEEGESEDEAPPPVVSQIKKDKGTKKNKGGKDSKQDAKAPKKEGKAKGAKKVKKGDTASVAMESLIAQISATPDLPKKKAAFAEFVSKTFKLDAATIAKVYKSIKKQRKGSK